MGEAHGLEACVAGSQAGVLDHGARVLADGVLGGAFSAGEDAGGVAGGELGDAVGGGCGVGGGDRDGGGGEGVETGIILPETGVVVCVARAEASAVDDVTLILALSVLIGAEALGVVAGAAA